jgi:anti-anti-sigma regulatory factor
MMRVTIHESPGGLTLKLEGKLAGPWAHEAQACWQRTLASHPEPSLCIDLSGVTMIDQAGKSFLAAAHAQGTRFVASGCLMRAIIAEMANAKKDPADVDLAMPRTTS